MDPNKQNNNEVVLAEYLSQLRQINEVKTNSPDIAMQLKRYLEKRDKLTSFSEQDGQYIIGSLPLSDEDISYRN